MAARMAMMAMTTSSSISVNAVRSSRIMLILSLHPPAWVHAVAVVEDVGRPVARLRGRTARQVIRGRLRARPAGVAVEEDIVAAVVVPLVAVLLCRLQLVLLVERLRSDPVAAGVAGRSPLLQRDRR